ncbi:TPR repeat-containing protein [Methanocaldococcus infernus ME]|uniref:TPR repeat-containing protein n=1 Tax=Methanocaldococcus infernus (strain DSM 11812 / JCM 15783 / ME) TaxID=573063 RepID=D5VR42_METIM|nr:CDC27 family protein [Methanocaldococcus infernus]ADG13045.1 TPR repeat-containing protein [Methanocaldococcus infernus ME]
MLKKFLSILDNFKKDDSKIAEEYLDKGEYKKAVELYLKILERDGHLKVSDLANLAFAYYNLEDYNLALEFIDKALKISERPEFKYIKGITLYKLGKFEEAYNYLKSASTTVKKPDLYYTLGELCLKFKKFKNAARFFMKAYQVTKDDIYLYKFGVAKFFMGEVSEALEVFEKIKDRNRKAKEVLESINEILKYIDYQPSLKLRRIIKNIEKGGEDLLTILDKILELEREEDLAYLYKAIIYRINNKNKEFLENLEKAMSLVKRSIYYIELSKYYEDEEKTISFLLKSNEIKENPLAHIYLALNNYKREENKKVEEHFKRVFEITDDEFYHILSLLGLYLINDNIDYLRKAYSYFKKIYDEEDYFLMVIGGYITYKLEMWETSYNLFKKALEIKESDEILKGLILSGTKANKLLEIETFLERINNFDDVDLKNPLLYLDIYHKYDRAQICLAILYRYILKNPIKAKIYLEHLLEEINILSLIKNLSARDELKRLVEYLNVKLEDEIYRFFTEDEYSVDNELIEKSKKVLYLFDYVI